MINKLTQNNNNFKVFPKRMTKEQKGKKKKKTPLVHNPAFGKLNFILSKNIYDPVGKKPQAKPKRVRVPKKKIISSDDSSSSDDLTHKSSKEATQGPRSPLKKKGLKRISKIKPSDTNSSKKGSKKASRKETPQNFKKTKPSETSFLISKKKGLDSDNSDQDERDLLESMNDQQFLQGHEEDSKPFDISIENDEIFVDDEESKRLETTDISQIEIDSNPIFFNKSYQLQDNIIDTTPLAIQENTQCAPQNYYHKPDPNEECKQQFEVMKKFEMGYKGGNQLRTLQEAFEKENPQYYCPIMFELADEHSYSHIFMVSPQDQPFVNIYPDPKEFFGFMQKLYNSEITYKYQGLLDCHMINKEEILLNVKVINKEKQYKKDKRKTFFFIGNKEEVFKLEEFIIEQLKSIHSFKG